MQIPIKIYYWTNGESYLHKESDRPLKLEAQQIVDVATSNQDSTRIIRSYVIVETGC